jgi:hypothetical protein
LTGFFRLRREAFGRRPQYPDNPVDPVKGFFKDKNPFLFFFVEDYSFFYDQTGRWRPEAGLI